MIGRRKIFIGSALAATLGARSASQAQTPQVQPPAINVLETMPAKDGTLSGKSEEYFVRFDKPVDHLHSTIEIRQGDKLVETLHPRFKSEPNVLFARAPNLQAGKYTMHWIVPAADGSTTYKGNIAFSVASGI